MMETFTPLTDEDVEAALGVLRSRELGGPHHPEVVRFETMLARSGGVRHAVTTSSGTSAIHGLLQALGVRSGDEVIVPAQTFIATATPVLMCGATPVVVDIEPETSCVDPKAVDAALTARTKAVIAVHLNGHPAAIDLLPPDVSIIGDACQAHGAMLFGRPVTAFGRASVLSFWQDKYITAAGEGGAVLTDDEELTEKVALIRSHAQQQIPGSGHFHHVSLGYNYRLTGVQAAVGVSQLGRLTELVAARRANAQRLTTLLAEVPGLMLPTERSGAVHAYWKYVVSVELDQFSAHRDDLVRGLRAEGVPAVPRYPIPLTRQPVLTDHARITPCPVADDAAERQIVLPLPATAGSPDVMDVAEATVKVLTALRR
jgi:perosamine synthetase